MNSSNHPSQNEHRRWSKRQFFRLSLLGMTIGTLLLPLVLYIFFHAEPSRSNLITCAGMLTGVWISFAIIYFWQVRGKE
jgi:glucose uptake protein GlcU